MTQTLQVAVCLFPRVTSTDYQGPFTYLSHTLDPVEPTAGPMLLPSLTYDDAKEQFDILLIPGGKPLRCPAVNPPSACPEFIKRQAPGAKYILTVCTGSLILARTGSCVGNAPRRTNLRFEAFENQTLGIEWVPKARWVATEDKRIWTGSGVSAGMDLAGGFLDHLVGKDLGLAMRSFIELSMKAEDDDEFADTMDWCELMSNFMNRISLHNCETFLFCLV
ncbi:class I glutamine amidotransferase-like protein [Mycena galopus ATCC 62051]|nr:class I glutamine amidotransferase-like protein [Mycena galopus ATCC 62051]